MKAHLPTRTRGGLMVIGFAALAAATACGSTVSGSTGSTNNDTNNTPAAVAGGGVVAINMNEWKIEGPTTYKVGKVDFKITNTGVAQHEFLVFHTSLAPSAFPLDNGNVNEDAPGMNLISDGDNLDGGGASQTRTVDFTAPGQYVFVCNLPGHFAQHMYTVVNVTA